MTLAASPTPAAIEIRQQRLLDVAAQPLLGLLPLIPAKAAAPLNALAIEPGDTEGRVVLRAGSPAAVATLHVQGECLQPVALPRSVLAAFRKRHSDCERIVADAISDTHIGWRSFGTDCTLALSHPQAPLLPPWPQPGEDIPELTSHPLYLAPQLLSTALHVASALGSTSIEWRLIADGSAFGAELLIDSIEPSSEQRISGTIHLARCARPTDAT